MKLKLQMSWRRRQAIPLLLAGLFLTATVVGAAVTENGDGRAGATLAPDHPAVQATMQVQDRFSAFFLDQDGIVGTATGIGPNGNPAILVLIESFDKAKGANIPGSIEGTPVVTRISGAFKALAKGGVPGPPGGSNEDDTGGECSAVDTTTRFPRPVAIGISTGHPNITAGTIGVRVSDGTSFYALSNNHVYADENQALIGDPVIQPGSYDGGSAPADTIGSLSDFEPIVFGAGGQNLFDAAIASVTSEDLGRGTPCDGYGLPRSQTADAEINLKVKKYGRTTGETRGQVSAINATVDVGYDGGVARFVDQIIIEPGGFSAGGDSGSLIVVDGKGKNKADDRKSVGLLFAGSFFYTIANPIDPVLDRFGVTIDGE